MNLDWLTCIQKFGVPLQVVNETWFKIFKERFKLEIELKSSYIDNYTIEVL
jgi:hypothetical protein